MRIDVGRVYGAVRTIAVVLLWAPLALSAAQQSSASMNAERILETLGVREGGTVCEIGAGDGSMSVAAARVVGPKGRVYASELGDSRVQRLREKVEASGAAQITVVAGDARATNFPDGGCDGIFLRDVYHHATEPSSLNAAIAAALKPGGRVAVIDFTPPGKEASDPGERSKDGSHGVTPETVAREMKGAGLELVSTETPGKRWFLVVLAKPRS